MNNPEEQFLHAVSAIQKLIAKAKQPKSTSLKSSIVALYTADDLNPLRFSGKIGMIQLDFDRGMKTHFLRMYDLQTLQILIELELFYGFGENFRKTQKSTLYIFDLFAEGIIGLEFRNQQQALAMAAKIKSVAPKSQQFRKLMNERNQKQQQQKKESSFFGKIKKKIGSVINSQVHHQQSVVLKVQKQKSIMMNFQTGELDTSNIPPEWEEILASAGLKKQDLKNKQIAKLVFEQTLIHQAKKAAEQNAGDVKKQHLKMIQQQSKHQQQQTTTCSNQQQQKQVKVGGSLPVPPPLNLQIPTLTLSPPPPLSTPSVRGSTNRADLMAEIRNNNLKLKPVKTTDKGVQIDASTLNKQERNDLAQHIRAKLQKRKLALNRRKASQEDDD